jgi:hypothetical protein
LHELCTDAALLCPKRPEFRREPLNFKALDFLPPRRKLQTVYEANHQQYRTPPYVGVQMKEHNRIRGRMKHLPDPSAGNQHSIHQQGDPDKKPD